MRKFWKRQPPVVINITVTCRYPKSDWAELAAAVSKELERQRACRV
jgi:hypothetical protein